MNDAVATLTAARELLSDPARWTKGAYARGRTGRTVQSCSKAAVCWCSIGAIHKVSLIAAHSEAIRAIITGPRGVAAFNDAPTTTHADILAVFDRAIAKAKAEAVS